MHHTTKEETEEVAKIFAAMRLVCPTPPPMHEDPPKELLIASVAMLLGKTMVVRKLPTRSNHIHLALGIIASCETAQDVHDLVWGGRNAN